MATFLIYVSMISIHVAQTAVVNYDQTTAITAVHHSYAAYCDADDITNWDCKWCNKIDSFSIHKVISIPDLQAYTGYDAHKKQVVISFRGSHSLTDVLLDSDSGQVIYQKNSNETWAIHRGFYYGLRDLFTKGLNQSIHHLFTEHKGSNVLIAGHSLGGAFAAITGFMLKVDKSFSSLQIGKVNVISFGCPRWGSKDLILHFEKVIASNWRIINKGDMIPQMPGESQGIYGFYHPATAILYTDYESLTYQICEGNGDDGPSCSYLPLFSEKIHLNYMNESETCKETTRLESENSECNDTENDYSVILVITLCVGWFFAFVFFCMFMLQRWRKNEQPDEGRNYRKINEL